MRAHSPGVNVYRCSGHATDESVEASEARSVKGFDPDEEIEVNSAGDARVKGT